MPSPKWTIILNEMPVEEISTASVSLNQQSDQLSELVSAFQTETNGHHVDNAKASPPPRAVAPATIPKVNDRIVVDDSDEWEEI